MIALVSVYDKDSNVQNMHVRFLYQILSERKPEQNISHKEMPFMDDHIKFVESKPYREWYIIYSGNRKVGSLYITKQDEIGLFILDEYQYNGYGTEALRFILENNKHTVFYANINPQNYKSIAFFKKFGFLWQPEKMMPGVKQYTYMRVI